jgi:hypothetical protein
MEVRMGEPSDIRRKAQGLKKEIGRRTIAVYVICFVLLVYFGWFAVNTLNPIVRIGSYLMVACTLFFGYQAFHWRRREIPKAEASTSAVISFYRAELERQRDFHRGICFWSRLVSMIPGYVLFCVGLVIAHPRTKEVVAIVVTCFFALCVLAVPLNLRRSSKYQRQINELG